MSIAGVVSSCVSAMVTLACLPVAVSAGQAQDLAKGALLMAEARKAIGGEDKLADVKRLQVKGTMRRGQGNLTLEGDTEIFLELPDKFRRNESLSIGLGGPGIDRVEILNGTEVIDENDGTGRGGDFGGRRGGGNPGFGGADDRGGRGQQIDPERLKDAQRRNRQSEVARLLIAMLLDTSAPVAWIGTAQAPEGTADVLEIKPADGAATRVFLDSLTHMPLMLTWSGGAGRAFARGGQGGQGGQTPPAAAAPRAAATLEMHLSEYKVVGGLKLPHLITRGTNGETSEEWAVKSYKLNPNFKANTFTK